MEEYQEMQYLRLMHRCMNAGQLRDDRTGVGTIGMYGEMMKFDLSNGTIPLLTTKRVHWEGVARELLWFISGETDSYVLEDDGIKIWQGNTSREFLDDRGLDHVPTGDIGPGYGFQWRNFNGDYDAWISDDVRTGKDQLNEIVELLRNDPNSRRAVLTAWNPLQNDEMALPPCHVMSTFSILNNKLHCTLTCRSQDLFLGTPYNIASYGILTHLIANDLGIEAGSFTWFGADVHIYKTHIEACEEQIDRDPTNFPTVNMPTGKSIFDMTYEDIELVGYNPEPAIKAPMAV